MTKERRHSRHASRSSYRGSSIGGSSPGLGGFLQGDKKKNALTPESEYGTLGIKVSLEGAAEQAQEIWGPALGGHEKEQTLKIVQDALDKHKEAYEAPGLIADAIKRKDHEDLVEQYAKAKRIAEEAHKLGEELVAKRRSPGNREIQKIVVAGRMWYDVQKQVEDYKRDIWRRLAVIPYNGATESNVKEQHMELISILLELGVEDNPISVWLFNRYDHLKTKIQVTSDRTKAEIEVLRRRLGNGKAPTIQAMGGYLQSLSRQGRLELKSTGQDSPEILELWERIYSFVDGMLGSHGILGEVLEFWQTVRGFIDGKTQRTLPIGLDGESQKHHRLSDQGIVVLQKGTAELVDMVRQNLYSFFVDAPMEDISVLYPPDTPTSAGPPRSPGMPPTSFRDPRFAFTKDHGFPSYPRNGESWERFAFWPPYANSLSGVDYLSRILTVLGSGASDMAGVSAFGKGDNGEALERLRSLVGSARERCVTAICGAWIKDAENIKVLEDWRRAADQRQITRMPANFQAFESAVLSGMQKILYIPDAMNKSASEDVVLPPPAKILQMVRSQFVTTLYKALSGMVENAERPLAITDEEAETAFLSPKKGGPVIGASLDTVDASDRVSLPSLTPEPPPDAKLTQHQNVRMLLTLSNLAALHSDVVPALISKFEDAFSVKLTDESKTITDVLGQIDSKLFLSFVRPALTKMQNMIYNGIASPTWAPAPGQKPTEPKPYVHDVLLQLVSIHTQVSTTAPSLLQKVLSWFLEELTIAMSVGFSRRPNYTLADIMQATLDLEFMSQVLVQYTSEKETELTSGVYAMMDERTDDQSRTGLQMELGGLKGHLKVVRERTKGEFGCFRRERRRQGTVSTRPHQGQSQQMSPQQRPLAY